ncbi:hypothetical protein Tco_0534842 [Tanacetum coccineum]
MPDTTRCGCGGYGGHNRLGRYHSSDVKWLSTARHPEGLRRHSPTPHGAAMVAVPSSDRHHDGGGSVVVVGDGLVAWRGCRRLCRGGGGGTRSMMENDDDGSGALAGKFFRQPENAMEAPDF